MGEIGGRKTWRDYEPPKIPSYVSSVNPSYSDLRKPYNVACLERIRDSKKTFEKQLNFELKQHEAVQSSAYDALRFHRHFALTTFWPPLHTRREIDYVLNDFYPWKPSELKRLNEMMAYKVV